jgi:hypothetical protein
MDVLATTTERRRKRGIPGMATSFLPRMATRQTTTRAKHSHFGLRNSWAWGHTASMVYGLTLLLCLVLRLLPHPFNLTPVGASAVFAGRQLSLPWAIAISWLGLVLANLALAQVKGYPVVDSSTPYVFAGIGLQAVLGYALRRIRGGAFGAAAAGAVVFFFVSNLGTFLASGIYSHTAQGLWACYVAGLPFLRATLLGDLLWTAALTPLYRWAARRGTRRTVAPRAADIA